MSSENSQDLPLDSNEETSHSENTNFASATVSPKRSWTYWALDFLIIAAVSIVICQANQDLMGRTVFKPESNFAMHLSFLSAFDCAMRSADNPIQAALITWVWPCFYPPGSYLITYLYSLIYGSGVISSLTSLTIFIPIMVASLYYINRPRYGALAGLCGVMAAAAIPECFLICHNYPSDFQVGLGVCLSLCLLFNCDIFTKRRMTLFFGLAFGYSLLFKSNVVWFIAPAMFILIMSKWREWTKNLPIVIWQWALILSAFTICFTFIPPLGNLQEDMISNATYISPQTIKMLLIVSTTCIVWWFLAPLSLGKYHSIPWLTNLSQSLSLTFLISIPWLMTNYNLFQAQRRVFAHQWDLYSNKEFLRQCAFEVYENSFGIFLCIIFAISLIYALTKWADVPCRALALSAFLGFPITACFLGSSPRYFLPAYLVSACCLVAPFYRSRTALAVLLILASGNAYISTLLPVYNPHRNDGYFHQRYKRYFPKRYYYANGKTNSSVFAKIWTACFGLSDPKAQQRWVAIRQDKERIGVPNSVDFGYDVAEDAFNGMLTWSYWHQGTLVPFYFKEDDTRIPPEQSHYLPILNAIRATSPMSWEKLHNYIIWHDNNDGAIIQENTIATCDYFIDIKTKCSQILSEDEVTRLMKATKLKHDTLPGENFVLHIWSRPEHAPKPDSLNRQENAFIPYLKYE